MAVGQPFLDPTLGTLICNANEAGAYILWSTYQPVLPVALAGAVELVARLRRTIALNEAPDSP